MIRPYGFFARFYYYRLLEEGLMKINKLKGVLDYYGKDMELFQIVRDTATSLCESYGYEEVITPIIEQTEVFVRSAGASSDVVGKEMYVFKDRGDRDIALKPESTASVMRMYVENKLYANPGIKKFYYCSPNFRYERPQAGRYRQFYQFGVEVMGEESPYLDAEVIELAYQMLVKLGIKKAKVYLNTLGSDATRARYREALKNYFEPNLGELCDDCKRRFETNPLRMLDCKVDGEKEIMKKAPKIANYLSEEDDAFFSELCKALDALKIPYAKNDRMVRGLDYYTNDIFEIIYEDESSPLNGLALIAGGRYNNLGQEFDGPQIPSIGFGMGIERMGGALAELGVIEAKKRVPVVAILSLSNQAKLKALELANNLRGEGYLVVMDYKNNNLKPQFKLTERECANWILILGDDELNNGTINVKNVASGLQEVIAQAELLAYLKKDVK